LWKILCTSKFPEIPAKSPYCEIYEKEERRINVDKVMKAKLEAQEKENERQAKRWEDPLVKITQEIEYIGYRNTKEVPSVIAFPLHKKILQVAFDHEMLSCCF